MYSKLQLLKTKLAKGEVLFHTKAEGEVNKLINENSNGEKVQHVGKNLLIRILFLVC